MSRKRHEEDVRRTVSREAHDGSGKVLPFWDASLALRVSRFMDNKSFHLAMQADRERLPHHEATLS